MKKFILILVAFLSIALSSAVAQQDDCGLCDPSVPWQQGQMIRSYNSCQLIIDYKWRECSDPVKRDLKLVKVTFAGTCNISGNTDLVIEFATRYLLNNIFEIFPSLLGLDSGDVYFSMQCCWGEVGTGTGGSYHIDYLEPCPEQTCCCEAEFTIEKDFENGIEKCRVATSKTQFSDGTGTYCGVGCEKVCDTYDRIFLWEGIAPVGTTPCGDDQCQAFWNTSGSNLVQKSYGSICNIEVYYQWRECGSDVEVKFGNVKFSGNDCGNLDDILKEAIEGILAQIASQLSLPQVVQVRIPTCWKTETVNGVNFARACYYDYCCVASYTLVSSGTGAKVESGSTSISSQFVTCGLPSPCTFICNTDNLGITENQTLSKRAARGVEGNLFETSSKVIPNPATENITIEIDSRFNGKMSISITDINGKELIVRELNKVSPSISTDINIKGFAKGTYFYFIKAGIHKISGGQFIKD